MKTETAKQKFNLLSEEFKRDGDKFCLVHFSSQDDYFTGMDNVDSFDALIIIKELVKKHGISSEVIAAMNINPVKSVEDN